VLRTFNENTRLQPESHELQMGMYNTSKQPLRWPPKTVSSNLEQETPLHKPLFAFPGVTQAAFLITSMSSTACSNESLPLHWVPVGNRIPRVG